MSTASEWPERLHSLFDPVRSLGRGGFGSVWLARSKDETLSYSLAAIKCVHSTSAADHTMAKVELGYAKREIAVLLELSHPNIVQLKSVAFEDTSGSHLLHLTDTPSPEFISEILRSFQPYHLYKCCLVLSYHSGPTLQQLLNHGGALGYPLARELARQLLLAVAYVHSHAVIHRDLKPDNLIISGTTLNDHLCWSESVDLEDAIRRSKYHLTLIDFGFARPLHPDDVHIDVGLRNLSIPPSDLPPNLQSNKDFSLMSIDKPLDVLHQDRSPINKEKERAIQSASVSHHRPFDMSALGHRHFAAPEILQNVHKFARRLSTSMDKSLGKSMNDSTSSSSRTSHLSNLFSRKKPPSKEHTTPLSEHVSTYGMVADAYSIGAVIRYMVTGCPPHVSTSTYISQQKNPLSLLGQSIGSLLRRKASKSVQNADHHAMDEIIVPRKKQFRYQQDLPEEVRFLILGLTHFDPQKRTSVRSALRSSWFASKEQNTVETVVFLHCAVEGYV